MYNDDENEEFKYSSVYRKTAKSNNGFKWLMILILLLVIIFYICYSKKFFAIENEEDLEEFENEEE